MSTHAKHRPSLSAPGIIVAIGASEGGDEALGGLLSSLPESADMAFIIALYRQKGGSPVLPEALAEHTRWNVQIAQHDAPPRAGHVYTVPDGHYATLKSGKIQLHAMEKAEDRRCPIDRLFYTLARDRGERGVAIILSGEGGDGTLGAKEVSKYGGMVLVQAPTTAAQTEMPQNAIDSGAADHVLSPVSITEELLAYAEHMCASGTKSEFEKLHEQVDNYLPHICERLLEVTGHNFRHYKVSTLARRVQRRIQVQRVESVTKYLEKLKNDAAETRNLFNDLLIGVTCFFRDPEAFDALTKEVFPRLFNDRRQGDIVRLWVAGCSSGEEAYTLAMLVQEYLEHYDSKPEVQIFATDIDEEALHTARRGAYSAAISEEVSPERLKRFFIKKGSLYHVTRELRAMVLFSVHNLINDPPFSKLDLISCRNLLIYLGSHLQKKLIPLFHYGLKPGGFLFLGPSENLSSHRELFRPINARHRISQRLPTAIQTSSLISGRTEPLHLAKPPNVASASETDIYLLMQRIVLDEFAPKTLVVDEEGQIICASGNLEKYLTVSAGAFHNQAMRLVREGLRVGLRATLAEAVRERRQITHAGLSLRTDEGLQRVMITVQPMPQMGDHGGLFLVVFQDVGAPLTSTEALASPPNEQAGMLIDQLERELLSTREDLERTVQDLEAANEELKSSNEELLSMNEELQSANEELETSKEEVQAANDTLNAVNSDLENLLASTQIATIFLDNKGHVRRVTPSASLIYNILPTDSGRPLSHFTHKIKNMPPLPTKQEIHAADKAIEHEVELQDGAWYVRRVLPYRTYDGASEGILIMFTEITDRKRSEIALRRSEERLRQALAASQLGLITWNMTDDTVSLSPRAAEIWGLSESVLPWKIMRDMVEPQDIENVLHALQNSLDNHSDYATEYRVNRPDGSQVWVLSMGRAEYDDAGRPLSMTRFVADVTERKAAEERLAGSEAIYRAVGESIDYGIWVCEPSGKNIYASPSFLKLVGLTQQECSDFGWSSVLHPDEAEETLELWKRCSAEVWPLWDREHRFKGVDGQWHPLLARGVPVRDKNGVVTRWVGINLDISQLKEAEAELRASEERFRTMADSAPILIWISDETKACTWFNKHWIDFVGRSMQQEIGLNWRQNVHPDDLERCMEIYMQAFDRREGFSMEIRLRRHDGVYRWLMDIGTPMYDMDGRFTGYIGSCTDITEHKQAMDALKEADFRKDEFLAILAHELRNPLAPLSNGLQVLRMAGGTKPELAKQTQLLMERQVAHMIRLVDDLLDVSRITRGKIQLHLHPLDMRSVIENAIDLSRPLITEKHHTLTINLPDAPLPVQGDMVRLSQVVANLLNNAAKYTSSGGEIDVTAHMIDDTILVSIRDNGIGIPKDMLPHIYEMFMQVDTAMERSQGGLGIGLTLVRKLVEMHGGTIQGHSDGLHKGSSFSIRLPRAAA